MESRNRATKKWSHGSPCRRRRQSRGKSLKSDLRNESREDRRAVMLNAQRCLAQDYRAASNSGPLTRCTLSMFSRSRRVSALSEMFSFLTRADSDARTSSSEASSGFSSWLSFVVQNRAHNDKRITALQSMIQSNDSSLPSLQHIRSSVHEDESNLGGWQTDNAKKNKLGSTRLKPVVH